MLPQFSLIPSLALALLRSGVAAVALNVLLDPTTYVPALIQYHAMARDWTTSQPLFEQYDYLEGNERFTISGLPNDRPVSYADGRGRIRTDAMKTLGLAALTNTMSHGLEQTLSEMYPKRQRLLMILWWTQRIAVAGWRYTRLASPHYRQAAENQRLLQQL